MISGTLYMFITIVVQMNKADIAQRFQLRVGCPVLCLPPFFSQNIACAVLDILIDLPDGIVPGDKGKELNGVVLFIGVFLEYKGIETFRDEFPRGFLMRDARLTDLTDGILRVDPHSAFDLIRRLTGDVHIGAFKTDAHDRDGLVRGEELRLDLFQLQLVFFGHIPEFDQQGKDLMILPAKDEHIVRETAVEIAVGLKIFVNIHQIDIGEETCQRATRNSGHVLSDRLAFGTVFVPPDQPGKEIHEFRIVRENVFELPDQDLLIDICGVALHIRFEGEIGMLLAVAELLVDLFDLGASGLMQAEGIQPVGKDMVVHPEQDESHISQQSLLISVEDEDLSLFAGKILGDLFQMGKMQIEVSLAEPLNIGDKRVAQNIGSEREKLISTAILILLRIDEVFFHPLIQQDIKNLVRKATPPYSEILYGNREHAP